MATRPKARKSGGGSRSAPPARSARRAGTKAARRLPAASRSGAQAKPGPVARSNQQLAVTGVGSARTAVGFTRTGAAIRVGVTVTHAVAGARATARIPTAGGSVRAPGGSGRGMRAAKPLGKREIKEFRRLLEEERDRLAEELEALEERIPEVEHQLGMDVGGTYDEDFADVAGDTFEREKGFAIESSVQALLAQVEEALARLDEGTYGICENCGRAIHPERLRALPYAKLCIECKANEERANGGGPGRP